MASVFGPTGSRPAPDMSAAKRLTRRERKALFAPAKPPRPPKGAAERPGELDEAEKPGALGWSRPGGGKTAIVARVPEVRGPTVQVCGLYPFSVGASLPLVGAPLGPHLEGRGTACGDPVSYFITGLINNPSAFCLGRPGLGKSSLVRHIAAFLPLKGVLPMVLSDFKPDYVELIKELDGQVIRVGRSAGFVNPLDPGPLAHRLPTLPEDVRARVLTAMRGQRMNVLEGLCNLALGSDLEAHETTILSKAMEIWDGEHPGEVPVIADILAVVQAAPQSLRLYAQDRGDLERYSDRTQRLVDALMALNGGSQTFGRVFAEPTTEPLELDRPVVFDLSEFEGMDAKLQAGVQLVCWAYGSTAVSGAKALAEAGLAPRRSYLLIMDELWRSLRAAEFMVYRVDEVTRLNRTLNLGQFLITHTMADLKVHSDKATEVAWGFVARSEMVYLGGLNPGEMGNLEEAFALSGKEIETLTDWAQGGEVNPMTNAVGTPRGRGKFMIKVGKSAGLPFKLELMPVELQTGIHDTNTAWADTAASMRRGAAEPLLTTDATV